MPKKYLVKVIAECIVMADNESEAIDKAYETSVVDENGNDITRSIKETRVIYCIDDIKG